MSKPPIITSDRAVYLFFEFTMATISIATEIIIINSSYVLISLILSVRIRTDDRYLSGFPDKYIKFFRKPFDI